MQTDSLFYRLFQTALALLFEDSVRSQVTDLPLDALEKLGEALLDFSSLEDLQQWLLNDHQH